MPLEKLTKVAYLGDLQVPKLDTTVYNLLTPPVTSAGGFVEPHLSHDVAGYSWFLSL